MQAPDSETGPKKRISKNANKVDQKIFTQLGAFSLYSSQIVVKLFFSVIRSLQKSKLEASDSVASCKIHYRVAT